MRKCPFCGENHLLEWVAVNIEDPFSQEPKKYAVKCLKCSALGPLENSRTEAEDSWNDRK